MLKIEHLFSIYMDIHFLAVVSVRCFVVASILMVSIMSTVTNHVTHTHEMLIYKHRQAERNAALHTHRIPSKHKKRRWSMLFKRLFLMTVRVLNIVCVFLLSPSGYFLLPPDSNRLSLTRWLRKPLRCDDCVCVRMCLLCLNYISFSCYLFRLLFSCAFDDF